MRPGHCSATISPRSAAKLVAPYFEAQSHLARTPDHLDQRGVIGGAGAVALDTVWREAHVRAHAALEMPGIVVVLDLPA